GEANSLSLEGRGAVITAVAAAGFPAQQVIIGTGSCAVGDTVALTRHALDSGYPNVLVLPPFYYKGVSDDGLFAFFSSVIESLHDFRLRLYLYHIPPMAIVPISLKLIGRLRETFGEVVAGLKDSSGDWTNTKAVLETYPRFRAFSGSEAFLADNLAAGGPGCISATTNITAPLAAKVLASHGRDRDALQRQLTEIRLALQKVPLIPALKRIMEWRTGDPAWRHILPPNTPLSREAEADLKATVTRFPWLTMPLEA
ncbi:MAG: dihydrodipicolinate synthase family protein, partial [Pseudomonadota bacterium]